MLSQLSVVLLASLQTQVATSAAQQDSANTATSKITVCHRFSDTSVFPLLMPATTARLLAERSPRFRLAEPEVCGDGIDNDCDFQRDEPDCTATCGDGVVNQDQEECDDGNRLGGDGCNESCELVQPPPSVSELNSFSCGHCMTTLCNQDDHPSLFESLVQPDSPAFSALACVLVSGCNSPGGAFGGIANCYCGEGPGQDCITNPSEPVDFAGPPNSWPLGVCRNQFEDAAGLFDFRDFPRMKAAIQDPENTMHLVATAMETCVQDYCYDECRPQLPDDQFVCGGVRCNRETEFCYISRGGFPGAQDHYECAPKPTACAELEFDDERCGACYADSLSLSPFGPFQSCERSPEGGIIFEYFFS